MEEVVDGINRKEERAWRMLFTQFYAPLCSYSEQYIMSHEEAEDIVQETLLNIWYKDIHFDDSRHLTYYLYKAVFNNTLTRLRKSQPHANPVNGEYGIWEEEDFEVTIREEMHRRLWAAIQQLPQRRREVIMLTIEGKSLYQISQELGMAISTVKKTKACAIKELRKTTNLSPLLLLF